MKNKICFCFGVVIMLSLGIVLSLEAGENYSFEIPSYSYLIVSGNSSPIDIQINGSIATIYSDKYEKPQNISIIFYNIKDEGVYTYSSSGGSYYPYVNKTKIVQEGGKSEINEETNNSKEEKDIPITNNHTYNLISKILLILVGISILFIVFVIFYNKEKKKVKGGKNE